MSRPVQVVTKTAESAMSGGNLVTFGTAPHAVKAAVSGDHALGVCVQPGECAVGDKVDVLMIGTADAIAGAAIAIGDSVAPDAQGRAVPVESGFATGFAVTAATAADDIFEIYVHPHTVVVSA